MHKRRCANSPTLHEEKKDNFGKYNSNFILKRHMKKTRDIIARERMSKSHLEKNLAENQIKSADNVEGKNCSSNEIKIEPVENVLVKPCSSLD